MKLFVGLGNPGVNYALNRHNIGFMVMDQIANDHRFGPWRDKFKGRLCEGKLNSKKVLPKLLSGMEILCLSEHLIKWRMLNQSQKH